MLGVIRKFPRAEPATATPHVHRLRSCILLCTLDSSVSRITVRLNAAVNERRKFFGPKALMTGAKIQRMHNRSDRSMRPSKISYLRARKRSSFVNYQNPPNGASSTNDLCSHKSLALLVRETLSATHSLRDDDHSSNRKQPLPRCRIPTQTT